MRIIHLVSNKVWGGGEQYVLDLATEFASRGNDVAIVSRNINAVTNRFTDAGLPVTTMALKGDIDIISPIKLARLIGKEQPVVLHVHNFKDATTALRARTLSRNSNVRIVMTRHLVKPAKIKSLYNRLDAMIFVSHLAKNEFMSTSPVIDTAKVHVIHNSIKQLPATTDNGQHNGLALMFHGRLSPEKGIDTLLKAFAQAQIADARLIIVGSGNQEYVKELQTIAENAGIAQQVTWAGHTSDIHPLIAKADIGVCPSRARESFGLSVVEYMAHGKPVITTNNGAQPEYITDGKDGILIAPDDVGALATAMQSLVSNEKRQAIGKAAKATFDAHLSFPIFIEKIEKVYKTILNK
ncbi:MAG: glycosyltransferase family 4 protein [Bacteroidaceae bacterium]|nr:glycosyltransferase family 4 protein [Bacteroidaceae bacterium]